MLHEVSYQLLPESDIKSNQNNSLTALKKSWQYYIQEDHLPSRKQEAARDLFLLFVSAGSALYGLIANKYAADKPEWERQLFIYGTVLPAAAVLINSTNEYLLRRASRRFPEELKQYYLPSSKLAFFIEDLAVVLVSAVASLAFSTAAWRYSDTWNPPLQIAWTAYIELVNTALHLLPVELVAFNHPVFSLPLKPFQLGFQWLHSISSTPEEKIQRDFLAFKCKKSAEIAGRFKKNLDRSVNQILQESFQWNGFSGEVRQWFSYIAKPDAMLNDLSKLEIKDILRREDVSGQLSRNSSASWMNRTGQQFKKVAYGIGAGWLLSGCAGFLADPFSTLSDSGLNEGFTITISVLASYFLGVLLGHMGGSSLQSDLTKAYKVLKGVGEVSIYAKLHTKSFGLWFFTNILLARYAYAMSVQLIKDHFSDSSLLNPLIGISISGVAYMSFFALQKFYEDYMTKFVSLNPCDENYLIAVFQRRIEDFKRHIPSDPDQLVQSFRQCSEEDVQLMLAMSKEELMAMTDFESLYAEYRQSNKSCSLKIKECCRRMFYSTRNQSNEQQELLLHGSLQS